MELHMVYVTTTHSVHDFSRFLILLRNSRPIKTSLRESRDEQGWPIHETPLAIDW